MQRNRTENQTNTTHEQVTKGLWDVEADHPLHIILPSILIVISLVTALLAAFVFYRKRKKLEYGLGGHGKFDDNYAKDLFPTDRIVRFDNKTGALDITRSGPLPSTQVSQAYIIQNDDVIKTPLCSSSDNVPTVPPNSKESSCSHPLPLRTSSPSMESSNLSGLEVSQDSVFDRLDVESCANHVHLGGCNSGFPDVVVGGEASAEFLPSEIKACSSIGTWFPTQEVDESSTEATKVQYPPADSSGDMQQGVCDLVRTSSGRKCFSTSQLHPNNDHGRSTVEDGKDKSKSWCHTKVVQSQSNEEISGPKGERARGKRRSSERNFQGSKKPEDKPIKLMEYSEVKPLSSGKSQVKPKSFSIKGTGLAITEGRAPGRKPELHHEYFLVEPEANVTTTESANPTCHMTPLRHEYFLVEPEPQEMLSSVCGIGSLGSGASSPIDFQGASSLHGQRVPGYNHHQHPDHRQCHQDPASLTREPSARKQDLVSGVHFPDILESPQGRRDLAPGRQAASSLRIGRQLSVDSQIPGSSKSQVPSALRRSSLRNGEAACLRNEYFEVEPEAHAQNGAPRQLSRAQTLQAKTPAPSLSNSKHRGDNHRFTQHRHPSRHVWASVRVAPKSHGGSSESMRREEGPQIIHLKKSMSEPGEGGVYPSNGGCQPSEGQGDDTNMYDRLLFPSVQARPRLCSAPGQMSVVEEKLS